MLFSFRMFWKNKKKLFKQKTVKSKLKNGLCHNGKIRIFIFTLTNRSTNTPKVLLDEKELWKNCNYYHNDLEGHWVYYYFLLTLGMNR